MKTLVTGAGGFAGRHLIRELAGYDYELYAFECPGVPPVEGVIDTLSGNLCDQSVLENAIKKLKPEACFHLGAMTFVPDGNSNPGLMLAVNIGGTLNVLNAIKTYSPDCRVLTVSTAHVYGPSGSDKPLTESNTFNPLDIYSASKAAADLSTLAFARHHGIHAMTVRPHNHTGPGQAPKFVIPSFVAQAKAIAIKKQAAVIKVGNLDCERDFIDVRDVVRAYRLIMEKGISGEAYNIGSERRYTIGTVLNMICDTLGIKPEIIVDEQRYRPTDRSSLLDTTKIYNDTGWAKEIDLTNTLKDMISGH